MLLMLIDGMDDNERRESQFVKSAPPPPASRDCLIIFSPLPLDVVILQQDPLSLSLSLFITLKYCRKAVV